MSQSHESQVLPDDLEQVIDKVCDAGLTYIRSRIPPTEHLDAQAEEDFRSCIRASFGFFTSEGQSTYLSDDGM